MKTIIGVAGLAGSGKDTVYQILKKRPEARVKRDAFADRLKISFARLFLETRGDADPYSGWTDEDCIAFANHFKEHGKILVPSFEGGEMPDGLPMHSWHIEESSGREILQRYGTEAHRDVFGQDFWTDQVLPPEGRRDEHEWDVLVLTDVRFPNEAVAVHTAGGVIWQVYRPDLEYTDGHSSEAGLPATMIDRILVNDGTLEEFESLVLETWMEHETLVDFGW